MNRFQTLNSLNELKWIKPKTNNYIHCCNQSVCYLCCKYLIGTLNLIDYCFCSFHFVNLLFGFMLWFIFVFVFVFPYFVCCVLILTWFVFDFGFHIEFSDTKQQTNWLDRIDWEISWVSSALRHHKTHAPNQLACVLLMFCHLNLKRPLWHLQIYFVQYLSPSKILINFLIFPINSVRTQLFYFNSLHYQSLHSQLSTEEQNDTLLWKYVSCWIAIGVNSDNFLYYCLQAVPISIPQASNFKPILMILDCFSAWNHFTQ